MDTSVVNRTDNMAYIKFSITAILVLVATVVMASKDQAIEGTTDFTNKENFNPLESLVLNQNESMRPESTKDGALRVKRQYNSDPYYNRRGRPYPYPLPIFLGGGGFGIGLGFARGPGGGFGGRGIGGRGGGRGGGFGGRGGGFGGRGGGFGGRGGGGGGHGGGGGRG